MSLPLFFTTQKCYTLGMQDRKVETAGEGLLKQADQTSQKHLKRIAAINKKTKGRGFPLKPVPIVEPATDDVLDHEEATAAEQEFVRRVRDGKPIKLSR